MIRLFVLLTSALLISASCGGNDETVVTDSGSVPPSLTGGENAGPVLIELDSAQTAHLKIETIAVQRGETTFPVTVSATVQPAPDHIFIVSAPIEGLVVKILAHEGERVKKGDVLLELESLEFANLLADYLTGSAEESFRKAQLDRQQQLYEKRIKSLRELEQSRVDYARAKTAVQAAYARLLAVGVDEQDLEMWKKSGSEHPHLPIRAPLDGIITEHLVDMGQAVERYARMGTIVNPQRVMVRGYVAPEDAAFVSEGNAVRIALRENMGEALSSSISSLVPLLDEQNRSVTVNSFVSNPPQWLRPGQNVRMEIKAQSPGEVIFIPFAAIQYEGDKPAVFVRLAPDQFEKRIIIDRISGKQAIVAGGLQPGEEVAVNQIFTLKALSKYSEFAEE